MKNAITIQINWKDTNPDLVVYYNFSLLDIIYINEKKHYRLLCDNRYYYFDMSKCAIKSVEVF